MGTKERGTTGVGSAVRWLAVGVALLLLAAGCGELSTVPVVEGPSPTALDSGLPLPSADTPIPYPLPTQEHPTLEPESTATVGPAPIVLGAEWASKELQETYVSTTLVVAPVGDGPGELGFQAHGVEPPTIANPFTVDAHGNIYVLDLVNRRVAQFDAQGHFVRNIPYPGTSEVWFPELLAVDLEGRIYLYDRGINTEQVAVKCYDAEGHLLQRFPAPSWFWWERSIRAMHVDEQGVLWVEGQGSYPNAPIIEGEPFQEVVVPLGTVGELIAEEEQQRRAVPGFLLPGGQTIIGYSPTMQGPAYLYNLQGRRIYEPRHGVVGIDQRGTFYLSEQRYVAEQQLTFMHRCTPEGETISVFGPLESGTGYGHRVSREMFVGRDGTVHVLLWDWEAGDAYRVIRWRLR